MPLEDDERAHVARVRSRIAEVIESAGGWIGFDRYMEMALYEPGLGYYSAGARKLGPGGDFTTAPEMSRLFGGCVARQCAEIIRALENTSILEIGAGSGRLAADVLSRLEELGCAPARYLVLEVSADLRERQRRTILERVPGLARRVEWLDAPPATAFDGVVLANEVLDALPVTRFRRGPERWEELGVTVEGNHFAYAPRAASASLAADCAVLEAAGGGWDTGYVSEYCPRLSAWTSAVTQAHRTGLALWIDYGLPRRHYYVRERHDGTLIGHFRQRAIHDPFFAPGLLDLSSWVDFTRLAEASVPAGYGLAGFATQAFFLAGLGLDAEMRHLAGDDPLEAARLAGEARRLVLPGEMGERFKVMAWLRGMESALSGFGLQDLRHTL